MPHRRKMKVALLCLLGVIIVGVNAATVWGDPTLTRENASRMVQANTELKQVEVVGLRQQINLTRTAVWKMQGSLMQRHTKTEFLERQTRDLGLLHWSLKRWDRRLLQARQRTQRILLNRGYLPPAQARILGHWLAVKLYGWDGQQWSCLDELWGRKDGRALESGWFAKADNPHSEAHGIPQADPGSKMGAGWWSSAYAQIKWGLKYIRTNGNFHSPCEALSYRLHHGSY